MILSLPLLTLHVLMWYQIWLEKSREQKLDYDMKSFNANKAQNGENGNGKYTQNAKTFDLLNVWLSESAAEASKPTVAKEGANQASQQVAQQV